MDEKQIKQLKLIRKNNDLIFQSLAEMGMSSKHMAWANTVIENADVPQELKQKMKAINQQIHDVQQELRTYKSPLVKKNIFP